MIVACVKLQYITREHAYVTIGKCRSIYGPQWWGYVFEFELIFFEFIEIYTIAEVHRALRSFVAI